MFGRVSRLGKLCCVYREGYWVRKEDPEFILPLRKLCWDMVLRLVAKKDQMGL